MTAPARSSAIIIGRLRTRSTTRPNTGEIRPGRANAKNTRPAAAFEPVSVLTHTPSARNIARSPNTDSVCPTTSSRASRCASRRRTGGRRRYVARSDQSREVLELGLERGPHRPRRHRSQKSRQVDLGGQRHAGGVVALRLELEHGGALAVAVDPLLDQAPGRIGLDDPDDHLLAHAHGHELAGHVAV